jgi:hypothetical protein
VQFTKDRETKNLQKTALTSKVVNPFTRARAPPFIGRRRDFYIPRLPSNLENIPSVNMYMNVFYIPWFTGLTSYIYKSATSSHSKPGLFEMTSLTWLLHDLRISYSWRTPLIVISESGLQPIPELRRFQLPEFCRFLVPGLHRFNHPEIDSKFTRRSQIRLLFFAYYWKAWKILETYQDPFMNVPLSRNWSPHLEDDSRTYLTNFSKPDFSRV